MPVSPSVHLPVSPAAVPTQAPPCTRTRTHTKDPSVPSSLHASPASANAPVSDRVSRRVDFLTPRATVSHPRVPGDWQVSREGGPTSGSTSAPPVGGHPTAAVGATGARLPRRHSLGDISHWQGTFPFRLPHRQVHRNPVSSMVARG